MKQLQVPFISGLSQCDDDRLLTALETSGAKFAVDQVCWPDEYPYQPLCGGILAHDGQSLAVLFHVRGMDLRAVNLTDNARQWEDSTCEFFVADPHDGTYYNFEMNCVGKILGAKGEGRQNRQVRAEADIARIRRYSSLPLQRYEENGSVHSWTIAMLVPFDLIGIPAGELPASLRANFYKCADLTDHVHFLSWNRVGCPSPDFHRPDYFGELFLSRV
ncbi:MAG: hypothetical protein IJ652_07375 [Bacteroidales bacterium]|nr:hypothetical protein [Bacteroidales bacterium]